MILAETVEHLHHAMLFDFRMLILLMTIQFVILLIVISLKK
jgi:hypothetical protein